MSMTQPRSGRSRERVLTVHAIGKHFGAVKALTGEAIRVHDGVVEGGVECLAHGRHDGQSRLGELADETRIDGIDVGRTVGDGRFAGIEDREQGLGEPSVGLFAHLDAAAS